MAVLCVDVGSTFTKAALVDVDAGRVLATASVPTTSGTDVLEGVADVRAMAEAGAGRSADEVLACSSAGGGLRVAVVGYERAVTAEAGRRVALSSGARVVHVHSGPLDTGSVADLGRERPDIVLLVGGTDGGNAEVLVHNARRLGIARLPVPVVLAGNAEGVGPARAELVRRGRRVAVAANVLPHIGEIDPLPARAAIREAFLRHVIGGKHLSRGPAFARLVRAATPDAVLAGVEALADGWPDAGVAGAGDVLVVDVGGATTDVYSVVTPRGEDAASSREVVATLWRARTVEGDLGVRWGAPGVVRAAEEEQLVAVGEREVLQEHARAMAAAPGALPADARAAARDARLAELALTVALRRHGRPERPGARPRPLREVRLVVGSGGVLRHGSPGVRAAVLAPAVGDHVGGWAVPDRARVAVDEGYLLFAAGLLAPFAPAAAARLASAGLSELPDPAVGGQRVR